MHQELFFLGFPLDRLRGGYNRQPLLYILLGSIDLPAEEIQIPVSYTHLYRIELVILVVSALFDQVHHIKDKRLVHNSAKGALIHTGAA